MIGKDRPRTDIFTNVHEVGHHTAVSRIWPSDIGTVVPFVLALMIETYEKYENDGVLNSGAARKHFSLATVARRMEESMKKGSHYSVARRHDDKYKVLGDGLFLGLIKTTPSRPRATRLLGARDNLFINDLYIFDDVQHEHIGGMLLAAASEESAGKKVLGDVLPARREYFSHLGFTAMQIEVEPVFIAGSPISTFRYEVDRQQLLQTLGQQFAAAGIDRSPYKH